MIEWRCRDAFSLARCEAVHPAARACVIEPPAGSASYSVYGDIVEAQLDDGQDASVLTAFREALALSSPGFRSLPFRQRERWGALRSPIHQLLEAEAARLRGAQTRGY